MLIYFGQISAQEMNKIDSLENELYSEEDPQQKMDILIELTDLILSSDPDRAFMLANQTVNLALEYDNPKNKLLAWLQIGEIYWMKTDFRTSLEFGNKAKSLAKNLDMDREYAESMILIARNFADLGDYEKSSDLNFEALKIFEENDDKIGISKALNRIGYVYYDQENYDKAMEYYLQSLAIAREIQDLVGISRGLNNVAAVYGIKEQYQNYAKNVMEALEINKKIGRKLWEGVNYYNLSTVNNYEKKYDTSIYYLNKASAIFTKLNNLSMLSNTYISISTYYSNLENNDSSLYYANLAFELGKKNDLKKIVYKAAKRLHNIYIDRNDFVNSYKYSMIEHRMKDTLEIENSMTRISQIEMLYEFDKIEQVNKNKQQHRDFSYIIAGTSIAFLFILLIIILIARHRIKVKNSIIEKKYLESELEIKNKELTTNVLGLMKKNEALAEIADKLMKVRNDAVKDETRLAIKKIAIELQKSTDHEIWDEFEVRFKQVHNDFYDKLMLKFPNLSPSEQRLSAFLRLNMTTKEISELTGQRPESLDTARVRLRKKLGISNTRINLVNFLSQI